MKRIELVCADCSRLNKCKSAPDSAEQLLTHTCPDWYPLHSALVSARQAIYNNFGAASRDAFRTKKERTMTPDAIINAANTGDVAALEELRNNTEINPVNLMLAACNVNKDQGGAIAEEYRNLSDDESRRLMLIGKLIDKAQSIASAPVEEEAPKPKRRSRRKKAEPKPEVQQTEEQIEAKKAEFVEAATVAASPAIDRTDEVLKALNVLSSRIDDIESKVNDLHAQARVIEVTSDRVSQVQRNLSRIRNAFTGFEVELIGSGTVADTPFLKATEDWE